MSLTEFAHNDGDDYLTELTHTDFQTAETYGHIPYRLLSVSVSKGSVVNDGTDTETVTIRCLSSLDMVNNNRETVLSYDGDVTVTVNGAEITKALTNGSVSFDLTTTKTAGSEIQVVTESLVDHPAESDRAIIEVESQ